MPFLQFGSLPADLTRRNMELFAREVMPALRPLGAVPSERIDVRAAGVTQPACNASTIATSTIDVERMRCPPDPPLSDASKKRPDASSKRR